MKLLKENIKNLILQVEYNYVNQHEDRELNKLFNYWNLLQTREVDIQKINNIKLDEILYSKYYWCSRYVDKYKLICTRDIGIEQQQYKIIEEIEQRLENGVDWKLIQMIEEGEI